MKFLPLTKRSQPRLPYKQIKKSLNPDLALEIT